MAYRIDNIYLSVSQKRTIGDDKLLAPLKATCYTEWLRVWSTCQNTVPVYGLGNYYNILKVITESSEIWKIIEFDMELYNMNLVTSLFFY